MSPACLVYRRLGHIITAFLSYGNRLEQCSTYFLACLAFADFGTCHVGRSLCPPQSAHAHAPEPQRSAYLGKECLSHWDFPFVGNNHPARSVWMERDSAARQLVCRIARRPPGIR